MTWLAYVILAVFSVIHPMKIIGRENIPAGPTVVCANHTGLSDPFFVARAIQLKRGLEIMGKEEILHWPVVGWLLDHMGLMIWVKRGKSDIHAIKSALKALKSDKKLIIFPEGTRHDELGEGKDGAAMMAIRSGAMILPVYVPAKKRLFRATTIVIGEPYQPFTEDRKAGPEDYHKATGVIMEKIAALEEANS